MIFGRNFTGIYIFGYRIGELLVGLLFVTSFLILINYLRDIENFKNYYFIIFFIILLFFFFSLFINKGGLLDTYTYKSSSYIWTLNVLFIVLLIDIRKYLINTKILFVLPIVYFLNAIYYPDFLYNFFNTYSDKFDFQKASDIFLVFVVSNLICRELYKNKVQPVIYLFISFAVLNPLFLFMSKGSFFPSVLFFLFSLFIYRKEIIQNYGKVALTVILSALIFVISTYEVYGNLTFDKDGRSAGEDNLISVETFQDNYISISENKNTMEIFASLYIVNNRIFSTENLLNWRLQIWQDVIYDQIKSKKFLFGYGYNEIIPAMDTPDRRGFDGTNEHVHNYFINIFARGGFAQIFLFLSLYILILKNNKFSILSFLYLISLFLVSSFDPSMETVRFPIIFFTYLSLFFMKKDNTYI